MPIYTARIKWKRIESNSDLDKIQDSGRCIVAFGADWMTPPKDMPMDVESVEKRDAEYTAVLDKYGAGRFYVDLSNQDLFFRQSFVGRLPW